MSPSNITVPGGNPPVPGSGVVSSVISGTSSSTSANKTQDERDMAMITEETQKIFATERYTCKSSFYVAMVNRFGKGEGFEHLLKLIVKQEVSLENLFFMVSFFVKSHQMYHKQFVEAYYDRFRDAVEMKLLSATSLQLRSIKLTRIEEII